MLLEAASEDRLEALYVLAIYTGLRQGELLGLKVGRPRGWGASGGVLGKTATGSGTVLTPLVCSMAVVSVVGGQIIARVRRVKPFTLVGTVVMTCGVSSQTRT
jgi:hypothetical protein